MFSLFQYLFAKNTSQKVSKNKFENSLALESTYLPFFWKIVWKEFPTFSFFFLLGKTIPERFSLFVNCLAWNL